MASSQAVRSICGTFHQGSGAFSFESRGKQCTPISYFALLYSRTKALSAWTSETIDFVLSQGDAMYNAVPHQRDYFDYPELPLSVYVEYENVMLSSRFGTHLSGFMHTEVPDAFDWCFSDAISAGCNQCVGCLVTLNNTTVAVMQINEAYYLFDSHSRNSNGLVDADGTAVLLCFPSARALHQHLKCLHQIEQSGRACINLWSDNHANRCQFDVIPVFAVSDFVDKVKATFCTDGLERKLPKASNLSGRSTAVPKKRKMTDCERRKKEAERQKIYRQRKREEQSAVEREETLKKQRDQKKAQRETAELRQSERIRDMTADRIRRENPVLRENEKSADRKAREVSRKDPLVRDKEKSTDRTARQVRRKDPLVGDKEKSANTKSSQVMRKDPLVRDKEKSTDRTARQVRRKDH